MPAPMIYQLIPPIILLITFLQCENTYHFLTVSIHLPKNQTLATARTIAEIGVYGPIIFSSVVKISEKYENLPKC
jgi:hypothetical protein